jgi:prepilin-type N-terminal cleavage/methylation domain-containing protein
MRLFRKTDSYGFTLIEVLLAVTLLAVVGVTLSSVYYNGVVISRKGKSTSRLQTQLMWAFMALQEDFHAAVPLVSERLDPEFFAFDGQSAELKFLIHKDNQLYVVYHKSIRESRDVIAQTRLGVSSERNVSVQTGETGGEDERWLWVRSERLLIDVLKQKSVEEFEEVLLRGLEQPVSWFFYNQQDAGTDRWLNQWQGDQPPRGLKVSMVYSDTEQSALNIEKMFVQPAGLASLTAEQN